MNLLCSVCHQIWKTKQWPQDWKRSVFIPIPKKGNAKKCPTYCTIIVILYASKVMLKIFQARLQQYMTWELPDVQAGFGKGKETRDQITNIHWIIEKARAFQKNIYLCFTVKESACNVGDLGLISGFSASSKSCLNIWKFSVHILLKSGLENLEHYFASVWDECNCAVVWAFFGIAFLWDWNENWPFPVLWPLPSFPCLLAYCVKHLHSIIF